MSTNGPNNIDGWQGHIDICKDEATTKQTAFITTMQKEISDHKHCKHWKLVHQSETEGAKNDHGNLEFQAKKGQHHGKGNKIQSQNLCTRWNAGERHKLLGNVFPSSAIDER